MRRLALQGGARRLLTRLHRWSGLTVMILLIIAGVTGSVLVFRTEIDAQLNPAIRHYWLLLAESHLMRRLFGSMLQRIWALPVPTG